MSDKRGSEVHIVGGKPSEGVEQPDVVVIESPESAYMISWTRKEILKGLDIGEDEVRIVGSKPWERIEQPDADFVDLDALQTGSVEEKDIGEDEVRII